MRDAFVIGLLPLLLVASCATEKAGSEDAGGGFKPLTERLSESNGFAQDSAGNWVPRQDKRSSFESAGASPYFNGEKYHKKTYQTGGYERKSWWGNKDYGRKPFEGNTDGGRFRQTARQEGQPAREAGSAAELAGPYRTDSYATSAAREAGTDRVGKPSDAETDVRRRVYPEPAIIDWREQRSITLEQTKGILGR